MVSRWCRRALWLVLVSTAAVGAQERDPDNRALADWLSMAKGAFDPPAPGTLPPELQQAAVRLSERAQARLDAEAPRWLADLRQRHGQEAHPWRMQLYLSQRLADELVRWYRQPLSDGLARAWTGAATKPGFCMVPDGTSWLSVRASRWTLIAPEVREALLKSEAEAVERLGTSPAVPDRPVPGAVEAAQERVVQVRLGRLQPTVPMPPMVARVLLAEERDLSAQHPALRCALNQWWLREQVALGGGDPAARAAALQAFFADLAPDVDDFTIRLFYVAGASGDAPSEGYPPLAQRQELTGSVLVRVSVDPAGRVERAQIVGRKLNVPGLSGRPLAFESLLDDAALRQARGHKAAASADGKPVQLTFEYVFRLE